MRSLVIVSAGTSQPSTTRMLADRIAAEGVERLSELEDTATVEAVEVAPLAVHVARASVTGVPSPELQAAIERIAAADALIAAAPVYKAGISGIFKSFVDVLDDDVLIAKPVVLAATAGSSRHALVVDEQMRSLFAYMRSLTLPTSVFAAPEDWGAAELGERVRRAATELAVVIQGQIEPRSWRPRGSDRVPLGVDQAQRAIDGPAPRGDAISALVRVHLGLPTTCGRVVRTQLVEPRPEPGGEPCGVGSAGRGDLGDGGCCHCRAEDVGLELHQQVVSGHASVDSQLPGLRDSCVGEHGLHQVVCLVRRCLQRRTRDMSLVGETREAYDHTARVVTPVRREQAGERGNEDDTFRAFDRACERLDLTGVVDDSEVVAQPLDQRAGNGHRPLECVDRFRVTELPRNGGDQAVLGHHRLLPEREVQEGPRAVRVLHVTVVEACVAEQ
jgi:FMN reductase